MKGSRNTKNSNLTMKRLVTIPSSSKDVGNNAQFDESMLKKSVDRGIKSGKSFSTIELMFMLKKSWASKNTDARARIAEVAVQMERLIRLWTELSWKKNIKHGGQFDLARYKCASERQNLYK